MKHLTKFFFLIFMVFLSCSQQETKEWEQSKILNEHETQTVGLSLSRASLETFVEHGITEVGIYVYLKDSLVYGENLPLNDGKLKIDVPLGEKLQTFVVANAGHMVDMDSLSKVVIYQDEHAQKEIYLSSVMDFTSDRSVSEVSVELKRIVGQVVFQPLETGEEIASITQFDSMELEFSNVGIGYKVSTGECIQDGVKVSTNLNSGFTASIYSFSTVNKELTGVNVVYIKEGEEINRTKRALDTNITFEVSKRTIVEMPILDEDYLKYPFTSTFRRSLNTDMRRTLIIKESNF